MKLREKEGRGYLNERGFLLEFCIIRVLFEVGSEFGNGLQANEEGYIEILNSVGEIAD